MTFSAILVAGGRGTRMKTLTPKQFLSLKGKAMVLYSFETLVSSPRISEVIVVCDPAYRSLFPGSTIFADPGERRQDTVWNGLQMISPKNKFVCIHDSARPFLLAQDLENVLDAAEQYGAATLAAPVKNTIKESNENGFITRTLDRSKLWEVYTPQVFEVSLIRKGFELVKEQVTDDNALVELIPYPIKLVLGSTSNIKITTPEDWILAQSLYPTRSKSWNLDLRESSWG